jgi:4-diphosphocytidyl-2-C-methyl-D-erythritol kinase
MRIPAPAKINLHLRVGPPRADDNGFHPLLTWMVTAGLFDTLTFVRQAVRASTDEASATGGTSTSSSSSSMSSSSQIFALSCSDPGLPTDSANLVTRVAIALADTLSRVGEGSTARGALSARDTGRVSAFLNKRIPPGAGLAGGSSDAVATLIALNQIWQVGWSREKLRTFAAQFGSDLPFFFADDGSAICTGRGEVVRPIAPPDTCRWAVLVLPKFSMSTPAVYRRFDEMRLGDERSITEEPDFAAWSKLPATQLMPRLINDLEPPAFSLRPELGELRASLDEKLNRVFRMSGSGSSLFSLCDAGFDEAESLAKRARDEMNVDAIAIEIAPKVKWETHAT